MISLIDFILNLFRDDNAAQAFVVDPEQALLDAGLPNVTAAQIQSVAATAVPSLALGAGDPVVGLQRAVSNHYGFEPHAAWAPTWAPQTDLLSNNDTRLLSPETTIYDNHSFNLGFGDFTLGDKTTADDGAVVVSGPNAGDIVTGDGAVLGDANSVNNGEIDNGAGSIVNVGHGNDTDQGNTSVGDDLLTNDDGTVIQTANGTTTNSQGNADWTVVDGDQTVVDGDNNGIDNSSGLVNTHASSVIDSHNSTTSVVDNSMQEETQYSGNYDASTHDNAASYDSSVHENTSTYAPTTHESTTVETHHSSVLDAHLGF